MFSLKNLTSQPHSDSIHFSQKEWCQCDLEKLKGETLRCMQSIYPIKSWFFYHHQFASTHAVEISSTTLKKLSIRVSHKIGRWKINKNQNSSHICYELLCTKDIWFVNKIPKHLYKNDEGDAFFFFFFVERTMVMLLLIYMYPCCIIVWFVWYMWKKRW